MGEITNAYESDIPHFGKHQKLSGEAAFIDVTTSKQSLWFNADIVAALELPPALGFVAKRIAIVDYGTDFADKHIIPEAPGLGRPVSRFGFRALNYEPDSHMLTYAPLEEGAVVALGRQDDQHRASYALGLTEIDSGNKMLSPEHVRVSTDGHAVRIQDVSEHGTVLDYLPY